MKRVNIESPYAVRIEQYTRYARRALLDSLRRGEAPFASHLLYTQAGVLVDREHADRVLGLAAGDAWRSVAELTAFYVDHGYSPGMQRAKEICETNGLLWEERRIGLED